MNDDTPTTLRTERLLLRPWKASDLAPFAELNADPHVMKYFPSLMDRISSDALAARIMARMEHRGWGFWAVEAVDSGSFIGFTGVSDVKFEASFTPATEIGWRLARDAWGQGYATEAAIAARDYAFDVIGVEDLVSFTPVDNGRSRAVMERLGMTHDPSDDFEHPSLPIGHVLREHVLYRQNVKDRPATGEVEPGAKPSRGHGDTGEQDGHDPRP